MGRICRWTGDHIGYRCDGPVERWIWQQGNKFVQGVTDCNSLCREKGRSGGRCVNGNADRSTWCPSGQRCQCYWYQHTNELEQINDWLIELLAAPRTRQHTVIKQFKLQETSVVIAVGWIIFIFMHARSPASWTLVFFWRPAIDRYFSYNVYLLANKLMMLCWLIDEWVRHCDVYLYTICARGKDGKGACLW